MALTLAVILNQAIMRYILPFFFVLTFSFCHAQEIIFSDTEPNQDDLILISELMGKSKNLIGFTSYFDNDLVSILVHNKSIYKNRISTDGLLGSAGGILFDRSCDSISVILNGEEFQLRNNPNYRFLYFYKNNNKYTIEYRKAPIISE
jgi:hypothetical protein